MRFATVCTLAFAICGKASRDKLAADSEATTEDLESSKTSLPCSKVARLAVILAGTSASAFAPRSSNTAVAPILTDNPRDGGLDAIRVRDSQVVGEVLPPSFRPALTTSTQFSRDPPSFHDIQSFPDQDDVVAFSNLNKQKNYESLFGTGRRSKWEMKEPKFNVLEEYTKQASGKVGNVAEEFKLKPEELAALWGFTHLDRDIINQIARGGQRVQFLDQNHENHLHYNIDAQFDIRCTLTRDEMMPWLKILNAGLKKMPIAAPGRLYLGFEWMNGKDSPGSWLTSLRSGSIAPISGFSSFTEDFCVAECSAGEYRTGMSPTIYVIDRHSSGVQLEQIGGNKEVVFSAGTEFVFEEDEKVRQEVQAEVQELWLKKVRQEVQAEVGELCAVDFNVLVIKEVPTSKN